MRVSTSAALLAVLLLGLFPLPADAQSPASQPVAIVEYVDGGDAGVEAFEYVEEGLLIRLSPGEKLILGYLGSCVRETIHGGEVTIGSIQSSVKGGSVIREEVECDGGSTDLSIAEASQSGAAAFREGPPAGSPGTLADPIKVFSVNPVFVFSEQVPELIIHRLDRDEPSLRVPVRQAWLNLADHKLSLGAGGVYEARIERVTLIFEIAPHAGSGGPLVGRAIRF